MYHLDSRNVIKVRERKNETQLLIHNYESRRRLKESFDGAHTTSRGRLLHGSTVRQEYKFSRIEETARGLKSFHSWPRRRSVVAEPKSCATWPDSKRM